MSVPHTGELTAAIAGQPYEFNGDRWSGPSASLVSQLNAATSLAPKQHFDVRSLAESILQRAGLTGEILSWKPDAWTETIEPGDLD